jgi:hypoxanthine phosphoribosyltransferase
MVEKLEAEDPNFEILFTEETIQQRVYELGEQITQEYAEEKETPLLLLGVLKGATPFLVDLSRRVKHSNLLIDYIGVSSYESEMTSSREPQITLDAKIPIQGKNVIIVEDIVDTGYSIDTLLNILRARKPKSIKVCAFLSKPDRREIEVPIDYLGFMIEDLWVQGYGLDTNEKGRNWPYIAYKK